MYYLYFHPAEWKRAKEQARCWTDISVRFLLLLSGLFALSHVYCRESCSPATFRIVCTLSPSDHQSFSRSNKITADISTNECLCVCVCLALFVCCCFFFFFRSKLIFLQKKKWSKLQIIYSQEHQLGSDPVWYMLEFKPLLK